jgi:transcriptional regulator PpsR
VKTFKLPNRSLGNLDAPEAASLIAAAADIALIIDDQGTIRDVAIHADDLAHSLEDGGAWAGRAWRDTVTIESRPKIEALLAGATTEGAGPALHVNHPSPGGREVPIMYSVVHLGSSAKLVAFGRDLRAISLLQQRLVDAQQSMERDYARLRDVERRYRVLFQSVDPVLIIDATTLNIVEANAASAALFGHQDDNGDKLRRRAIGRLFAPESAAAVQRLLTDVRAHGRPDEAVVSLDDDLSVRVAALLFREEQTSLFLVRLTVMTNDDESPAALANMPSARLLELARQAPDAFVVTGSDLRIVTANPAFLEMAQVSAEADVRGQPIERWVGRPSVDLDVLTANLRQRGSVKLFATGVVGERGGRFDVEISTVAIISEGAPSFGFAIRDIGRRFVSGGDRFDGRLEGRLDTAAIKRLPRSVEQLTELIGHVSLKEMVRESTDVIERLCIEAALELTGDNRASAAEMLGLSRQSLYVKLRKYGAGDDVSDDETD